MGRLGDLLLRLTPQIYHAVYQAPDEIGGREVVRLYSLTVHGNIRPTLGPPREGRGAGHVRLVGRLNGRGRRCEERASLTE